jgi:hypothetical protein
VAAQWVLLKTTVPVNNVRSVPTPIKILKQLANLARRAPTPTNSAFPLTHNAKVAHPAPSRFKPVLHFLLNVPTAPWALTPTKERLLAPFVQLELMPINNALLLPA